MSTFLWTPSYSSTLDEEPRVLRAAFGDGYTQRVGDGVNTILKKWSLRFQDRPNAEGAAIRAFLRNRGGVDAFSWMDADGYSGAWICAKWSSGFDDFGTHSITAVFEEVPEVLLGSAIGSGGTVVALDANVATDPAQGFTVTVPAEATLTLQYEATQAWSFTPTDGYNVYSYPYTWRTDMLVRNNTTGGVTAVFDTGRYLTEGQAITAATGASATFLGGASYTLFLDDATVADNRGGLNVRVIVQ